MIDLDELDAWVMQAQLRSVDHSNVTIDPDTADLANLPGGIYRVDDETSYFHCPRLKRTF